MKWLLTLIIVACPTVGSAQMCVTATDPPQITNDPRLCKKRGSKSFGRMSRKSRRIARRYPIDENFDFKKWAPQSSLKSRERARRYSHWVSHYARTYEIPEALIWGVMRIESNFFPDAVSHKGAMGLMQLMPETAKDMGVKDPFNPRQNIQGATKLLRQLADQFDGNTVKVLAAYHAGCGAVQRAGGIPFEATRHYVEKVLSAYQAYRIQGPSGS